MCTAWWGGPQWRQGRCPGWTLQLLPRGSSFVFVASEPAGVSPPAPCCSCFLGLLVWGPKRSEALTLLLGGPKSLLFFLLWRLVYSVQGCCSLWGNGLTRFNVRLWAEAPGSEEVGKQTHWVQRSHLTCHHTCRQQPLPACAAWGRSAGHSLLDPWETDTGCNPIRDALLSQPQPSTIPPGCVGLCSLQRAQNAISFEPHSSPSVWGRVGRNYCILFRRGRSDWRSHRAWARPVVQLGCCTGPSWPPSQPLLHTSFSSRRKGAASSLVSDWLCLRAITGFQKDLLDQDPKEGN